MPRRSPLATLRLFVLLCILGGIAGSNYIVRERTTSWKQTLWVTVYPVRGDDSPATDEFVAALDDAAFDDIETFIEGEAAEWGVPLERPVRVDLGAAVDTLPPLPPARPNVLQRGWWVLRLRYWAYRALANHPGPPPDVRMFVVYHDPARLAAAPHSVGLQRGLLGVAHVFAARHAQGSNNFVIAHELLHTLGASDKYSLRDGLPLYPLGYAEPERDPPLPQRYAEIMGGRIPVTERDARIPDGLHEVLVGPATAAEIRWIAP